MLNSLLQNVLDAETGSRGYLLTGDPRYLRALRRGRRPRSATSSTPCASSTRASPTEARGLAQLTRNVQRKLAEMDLSVRMRKQGNEDAWKFVLMTDVGARSTWTRSATRRPGWWR